MAAEAVGKCNAFLVSSPTLLQSGVRKSQKESERVQVIHEAGNNTRWRLPEGVEGCQGFGKGCNCSHGRRKTIVAKAGVSMNMDGKKGRTSQQAGGQGRQEGGRRSCDICKRGEKKSEET